MYTHIQIHNRQTRTQKDILTVPALRLLSGPFQHLVRDRCFFKTFPLPLISSQHFWVRVLLRKNSTVMKLSIWSVPTGSGKVLLRKGGTCSTTGCHIRLMGLATEHENTYSLSQHRQQVLWYSLSYVTNDTMHHKVQIRLTNQRLSI